MGADNVAQPGYHVVGSVRSARFLQRSCKANSAQGRLLRRFMNDCVTSGQGWSQLVEREIERHVKRCDDADDTARLTNRECQPPCADGSSVKGHNLTAKLASCPGRCNRGLNGPIHLDLR